MRVGCAAPGGGDGGRAAFRARVYSVRMGEGRLATPVGDGKSLPRADRSGEQAGAGGSSRALAKGDGA